MVSVRKNERWCRSEKMNDGVGQKKMNDGVGQKKMNDGRTK